MNCSIFNFLDYREFLKTAIAELKVSKPHFSHRFIAQHLGLRSSGYFLYVLQGKRKLSEELAIATAKLLKLSKKESDFLVLLISFAHTKSLHEKQFLFERITLAKRKTKKVLEVGQYCFYEKWYHLAIREYVAIHAFSDNYEELARSLMPCITPTQAKESVELLEKTGFIRKNKEGLFERLDSVTSTGDEWKSATIHNLQMQLLDISKEALEKLPKEIRDFSNCTVSMSPQTFRLVQEKIADLRSYILELARIDTKPTNIYQINIQAYPMHVSGEDNVK